ncbi:MAG: DUF1569 domain-containing protein [Planctomycetes bacterium]|nr:DUF1569 domain-containing protein [Planctomycetota bacterium]MCH9725847.1 DUF1569 domain-containing protein [Planctomycetota bacterium]MCH9775411.1 DUF1569 domain-containing protein [Planctomycetota bacterium]MCH9790268.1 DUF1569 domain-containing protein [Planctomycetota bacterium]MDF1743793.1 DUF1569 domain-containing protein [Gimesia sp.]
MTVVTKKVTGRRTVCYESLDDLLKDADQMSQSDVHLLGNWSLGQILKHLAMSLDASIDGMDFKLPAPVRFLMTLLMKRKFLTKALPPGFKSTSKFIPDETTTEEGLAALRTAVKRQQSESARVDHPGFGKMTNKEWNDFNLRHAEMHMSFVLPKSQT